MSKQSKELRLAYLFKNLGLISENQFQSVLKKLDKSSRGIKDILMQEVNLSTFKDLMTLEIPVPFQKSGKEALRDKIREMGVFSDKDLEAIFFEDEYSRQKFEEYLTDKNIVTHAELTSARKQAKESGMSLGRVLINMKKVSPSELSGILRSLHEDLTLASRENLFINLLLSQKIITKKELTELQKDARKKKKRLTRHLIDKNVLTKESIEELITSSLSPVHLSADQVSSELLSLIPISLMRSKRVLPYKKKGRELTVVMEDPFDFATIDLISILTKCRVVPVQGDEANIYRILEEFYPAVEKKPEEKKKSDKVELSNKSNEILEDDSLRLVDNSSTVQLVATIIENAINARATDIHLEPQVNEVRVRFRIDGLLHDIMTIPKEMELPIIARIKILADMDVAERRRPQDGHYSFEVDSRVYDMRIATLPTYWGEKLVIRILDESNMLKGLAHLGLAKSDLAKVESLISSSYGMILTTGPIGSGKTTTLYSILNQLNIIHSNIVTIEDPIEYQLPGINQVQVDRKVDLTFANGLRAVLRQDANILMVGEIRDKETAEIATRAALTGHLVLSTLHTNTAPGAIITLKHLGVNPYMVASSVMGVIAQRLVRKICPDCKTEHSYSAGIMRDLDLPVRKKLFIGKGCEQCFRTGYSGRIGLFEVLRLDDALREMIVRGDSENEIRKKALEKGLVLLKENGKKAVTEGITTPLEVLKVVNI